ALTAIGLCAALAVGAGWLEQWRLDRPDRSAAIRFRVTNAADSGPGSLRDAVLLADRAAGRARITIAVQRIVLESALPPLVNPNGVVVESVGGVEIDGSGIAGAVIDIASP